MVVSTHRGTRNNGGGTDHQMEGSMVQTAHDQVPPEVPVKLPGVPSNRGGWTWPEVPKITKPVDLVDNGVVGWMGSYVHYI